MPEPPTPDMAANGERVRASGLCSFCEFRFTDEVVARFPEPSMPGGWAYVELRHLDEATIAALYKSPYGCSEAGALSSDREA